ncbi:MAG: DNA mismatch endonuclease Vsr [Thermoplasmatota archaeon]
MTDNLAPDVRRALMRSIRTSGSEPELVLRAALRRAEIPFRTQVHLPGRPDVGLTRQRAVIFVHGCFWHGCPNHGTLPASRRSFWERKIKGNRRRDQRVTRRLRRMGFAVFTIWECRMGARLPGLISRFGGR